MDEVQKECRYWRGSSSMSVILRGTEMQQKCINGSFLTDICYIDILLYLSTLREDQHGWATRKNYRY